MRLLTYVVRVTGQVIHMAWTTRRLSMLLLALLGVPLFLLALFLSAATPFVIYPFV